MVSGSISLRYSRFFSPFPHGTSSLSVSQEYLALPDGPGGFSQGSTCPDLLRIPIRFIKTVPIRDYHSLWCVFPNTSNPALQPISGSYYPHIAVTIWVWAVPISLATTLGITFVFFSSAYLDVSVQRVCPSLRCSTSSMYWVAPFGYLRINSYVPIHATFRSLSRPSSPLRA